MALERSGDPWSGNTYNGFAGSTRPAPAAAAPARHVPPRAMMLGGVAAAVVLGVGFGFLARPNLGPADKPAVRAAPAASTVTPGADQVPISITPPPPELPAEAAPDRLQVLPPELASAARRTTPAATPAPARVQTVIQTPTIAPAPAAPPAPMIVEAPPAAAPAPPPLRASFDCAAARPGAEQAICSDPGLAAQDRQMARAYRRALAAGVDPSELRQEQRDWLDIREDAASRSRRALASVYAQRQADLEQMAAGIAPDEVR